MFSNHQKGKDKAVAKEPVTVNKVMAFLPDSSGLLDEADLSFYPPLLEEQELLGLD